MKNANALIGILALLILLVLVRSFEASLFYDPLLEFFRKEDKTLPDYESFKLFLGIAFRYGINTLLSLGIIWLAFKDKAILRLAALLYLAFFVVLTALLFISLTDDTPNLMLIFYIRRFLIQPLLLLLFLPAFFYQKNKRNN
ncbi:exosortase F system-associated membrane protein [Flavobacterium sp.]|uniref:exosortase F system-associated membrane protein n=2 Tax=Flavobacterium sp. TaxID=239 RepID=UPI0040341957